MTLVLFPGPYYRATRDAYFIMTYLRATHDPALPTAEVPVRTDGKHAQYFHAKDAALTERLAAQLHRVYASEQWASVQTTRSDDHGAPGRGQHADAGGGGSRSESESDRHREPESPMSNLKRQRVAVEDARTTRTVPVEHSICSESFQV